MESRARPDASPREVGSGTGVIRSLLEGSPSEADNYRRAARAVFSWACLLAAAALATAVTGWDLLRSLL